MRFLPGRVRCEMAAVSLQSKPAILTAGKGVGGRANANCERGDLAYGRQCQTQHYLQMPVVFAKLSANMATLCANGSASLCGELRGGRELGTNMSRSKSPFKDSTLSVH